MTSPAPEETLASELNAEAEFWHEIGPSHHYVADRLRQAARAISSLSAEKEILQTALGAMRATIKGELGELILDLGRVEGSLDSQTYDEMRKQDDWPDDAEFHVVLTARDLRKISEANTLLVRTMMNALNASEEKADLRAQLAAAREAERQRDDLAMLVQQMIYRHSKNLSLDDRLAKAESYLSRNNLNGFILREGPPFQEPRDE